MLPIRTQLIIAGSVVLIALGSLQIRSCHPDVKRQSDKREQVSTQAVGKQREKVNAEISTQRRNIVKTRKKKRSAVETITRKYDKQTGKLYQEKISRSITEKEQDAHKQEKKDIKRVDTQQTQVLTTVDSNTKTVDKEVVTTNTSSSGTSIKVIAVLPVDVGLAKELVRIPDDTPILGGAAVNIHGTIVSPSVGVSISKPVLPNIDLLIGTGLDLTKASTLLQGELATRNIIGLSIKLSL